MTCFSLQSDAQPISVEVKGAANEASLAEATAAMKPVNAYYAVHKLSPSVTSILLDVHDNPDRIESAKPIFTEHLNKAHNLLRAAELEVANLPPLGANLTGDALKRAIKVREFIPELERVTIQVVSNWEQQFVALEERDFQKYKTLLAGEVDTSITLLEAAGIIGKAALVAVDERGAGYNVQESIVLGNEFLVEFLKFTQVSNDFTRQNGSNSTGKMQELVDRIDATIATGRIKLDAGYESLGELSESDFTKSAADSFDCLQRSFAVEQQIRSEFEIYLASAKLIESSSLEEDGLNSLALAESNVVSLVSERSKLKFECYELATVVASHMK